MSKIPPEASDATVAVTKPEVVRKKKAKKKKSKSKAGSNTASVRPYPRVSLERALAIPMALKEKNGGNSWPAKELAGGVGLSPKNVDFYYLLSASKKFGLTEGAKLTGEVSLTPLGRSIVFTGSPEAEIDGKRKAFLSVEPFKLVLNHYNGNKLPEMRYLGNTLQDKFNLPIEFHEEFVKLFRQNCEFVGWKQGLDLNSSGNQLNPQFHTGDDEVITLGEPSTKTGLTCFVIMPFTEKTGIYSFGFFGEVLKSLITPALTDAGFEVRTALRQGTEIIHSTIVNEIIEADMCVCDLTEHNPNVLFELGMRLANEKPVALIHADGTLRVFDVDNVLRVLPYKKELWPTTLETNIPELSAHVKATWENRNTNESYCSLLRSTKKKKVLAASA